MKRAPKLFLLSFCAAIVINFGVSFTITDAVVKVGIQSMATFITSKGRVVKNCALF